MEFSGEFETHLTIRPDGGHDVESLRAWAGSRRLKFTHIELSGGESASQPMVTFAGRGTLPEQLGVARRLIAQMREAGFQVCRVKIEAAPSNRGIPQTPDDAALHPAERYFEHHVKLLLPADHAQSAMASLARLGLLHAAHASRNAIRFRADGRQERFLTQRCRGVDQPMARRQLQALREDLTEHGYRILEVEEEFVVHDSNLALDRGWAEA